MAPNLRANYIRPFLLFFASNSNGLQPKSDGPQPKSKLYQTFLTFSLVFLFPIAMASNLRAMAPNLRANYIRPFLPFL